MEKMIENGQISVATSASEKVVKYVNNIHCKGTKAYCKVESHKYASDTHSTHSVWVDYYYDIKQLKECFHHNDYMDAEKFYVKEGRNWVEFNYDYEAVEKAKKAETEKADNEAITEVETPTEAEVITEAVPAEAEDNNVYFTYNDIYEALNTILNAKSSKLQVELHEISDITDIPKSMCFYRQSCGNIGINFINYCDADDPLAECYDFAEDYLRENASDIAFELSYRPFNDDPHPQTEDFYFKTEEYKKAEAEAVKALPF